MSLPDRAQEFKELLDHLERSGAHLREGGRQLLLALEELFQVINRALSLAGKDQPFFRTVMAGFVMLQAILSRAVEQIPPLQDEKELLRLRLDTLGLLRDLLRGELLRLEPGSDAPRKEAILLALGYVDQEMERWGEKLHLLQVQGEGKGGYTAIPVEETL